MPTVKEIYERSKYLVDKGDGTRRAHFGLVDVEAKERIANPKRRVRFVKEMGSPEEYSEWNAEFTRYAEVAGNPIIARSIMLRLLKQLSDDSIRRLAEDKP